MQTQPKRAIRRIILASTSPRRIELLKSARVEFEVMSPGTDEAERPGEAPAEMVSRLAREKANAAARQLPVDSSASSEPAAVLVKEGSKLVASIPAGGVSKHRGDAGSSTLIIAADTTVVSPDGRSVLGKPENAEQAFRMLNTLAGQTHEVLTAYCLLEVTASNAQPPPIQHVAVISTHVTVRPLSDEQIRRYIQSGEPMDKAGAYAAQGLGMALIDRIDGSYTNVVGLPMSQLLTDLEQIFGLPLFGTVK